MVMWSFPLKPHRRNTTSDTKWPKEAIGNSPPRPRDTFQPKSPADLPASIWECTPHPTTANPRRVPTSTGRNIPSDRNRIKDNNEKQVHVRSGRLHGRPDTFLCFLFGFCCCF